MLIDANLLVYAFRADSEHHAASRRWLQEDVVNGNVTFTIAGVTASAFIRISTHHRIFSRPASSTEAANFLRLLFQAPGYRPLTHSEQMMPRFLDICELTRATGNLVSDAYLAALAIDVGHELMSADNDFARFPGLRWKNPLLPPGSRGAAVRKKKH